MSRPKSDVKMDRVEIQLNEDLLRLFDEWWRQNHYPTRNEAVRQIMREKVVVPAKIGD